MRQTASLAATKRQISRPAFPTHLLLACTGVRQPLRQESHLQSPPASGTGSDCNMPAWRRTGLLVSKRRTDKPVAPSLAPPLHLDDLCFHTRAGSAGLWQETIFYVAMETIFVISKCGQTPGRSGLIFESAAGSAWLYLKSCRADHVQELPWC